MSTDTTPTLAERHVLAALAKGPMTPAEVKALTIGKPKIAVIRGLLWSLVAKDLVEVPEPGVSVFRLTRSGRAAVLGR